MNPAVKIRKLCDLLDIEYFDGKEEFWHNQHSHFLFGSNTVRNSDKLVFYEQQFDNCILTYLRENFKYENKITKQILSVLDAYEISNETFVDENVKQLKGKLATYKPIFKFYHRMKSTHIYSINHVISNLKWKR